jgi:hypothetical protein
VFPEKIFLHHHCSRHLPPSLLQDCSAIIILYIQCFWRQAWKHMLKDTVRSPAKSCIYEVNNILATFLIEEPWCPKPILPSPGKILSAGGIIYGLCWRAQLTLIGGCIKYDLADDSVVLPTAGEVGGKFCCVRVFQSLNTFFYRHLNMLAHHFLFFLKSSMAQM